MEKRRGWMRPPLFSYLPPQKCVDWNHIFGKVVSRKCSDKR
ncbi:hypothetical protein HMPREF0083_02547 [Aneurinibacillus aneurinilyticus ATCC 12856]|uniref:Uncharacterized protein n=1 Tax=Aneurinibacillus aneurinilyticus ATCC 12856 TaxID=649747 RepID=U1YB93_ANEAE|nr:hypothetical protein HMPREF0083_02547 [Aneurinibacillus aneurinilyticus ATCC 12856]